MLDEDAKMQGRRTSVLGDYFRAAARYPWLFLGVIAAILAATGTNIVAPLFLKDFINLVATSTPQNAPVSAMLVALSLFGLGMFGNWLAYRLQMLTGTRLNANVQSDLTNRAFSYLIRHGHSFFTSNFTGTLTRRVGRYSSAFQQVYYSTIESMMPTFLYATGVIIVLGLQSAWLGIGLLIWTIFFVGLQYVMTRWRYQYKVLRAKADSRVTGALSDSVGNHSAVTSYAAEQYESNRLAQIVADWHAASMKAWNSDTINYAIQGFLTRFAQVGLLLLSLYLWLNGSITVGDLVLVQVYVFTLMDQIGAIGSNMRQLYDAFADASEMIEIIDKPHEVQDASDARALADPKGAIEFDSVGFEFTTESAVLSGFSLSVAPGEKVALVGPSGAGKSTITKLLLRLHDVTSGAIRIDGMDVREITQTSLRRNIAFVPQESVLFHRTLRENIAYGNPEANLEEVIAAAKKAHCHDFIERLPQGYETHVGERGVKLSGGERQRVAIARAILKNAPILILDEATSALDSESEALIQDALKVLMEGKTVIVIAHRLSTIMTMDRIVVIENGAIAAEGTHDELVRHEGGLYHKLWSIQAGSFIADKGEEGMLG